MDQSRVLVKYILPLSEVVIDFNDQLKSLSSGYARWPLDHHSHALIPVSYTVNICTYTQIPSVPSSSQWSALCTLNCYQFLLLSLLPLFPAIIWTTMYLFITS